jgi:hypothetical protein
MPAPRVFWLSASVALLVIAASVSYYLLIALPKSQQQRDELNAEIAAKQAKEKLAADCSEQARRAGEDMVKYSSVFSVASKVAGTSNHYNRKLGKCIVDVQTVDKNSTSETILDAYEQSSLFLCVTTFTPKAASRMQRTCLDSQSKPIDPAEADKQIETLMRD